MGFGGDEVRQSFDEDPPIDPEKELADVRPGNPVWMKARSLPAVDFQGRVDFIAAADYRKGSRLSRRVQLLLDAIVADVAYRREAFRCVLENRSGR